MFYYSLEDKKSLIKKTIPQFEDEQKNIATTLYSAISPGTEMAAYLGYPPLRPMKLYPRLMGYCNLARDNETNEFILTHQSHRSHFQYSPDDVLMRFENLDNHQQKIASTLYLYHLGFDALSKAKKIQDKPQSVAIIGYGTLGLGCALLANAVSLETTVITGREILNKPNGLNFISKSQATDMNFDWVINTSNSWDDHFLSLKIANRFSPIVMIGFPGRGQDTPSQNPLASQYVYDKQLTLMSCGDIPLDEIKTNLQSIWDFIKTGKIDGNFMISGIYASQNLADAYHDLENRSPETMTYILDWNDSEQNL